LDEIYPIIQNTLEDDYKNLYDPMTGMYRGESSFLDWREQTYPKWMNNLDIAVSENLGTNAMHFKAHKIMAEMARLKGAPADVYEQRAANIAKGMNQYLWMNDKGYYAQYLYGRPHLSVSPRAESLGEALSVLFGVADQDRAVSVISKSPVTAYGATCIFPQIPAIPPYHNNAIWPFVQSYWNLAAAKVGNEEVLKHGLASIYRAGAFFLSNYENMVAQTGDYLGTEINSDRMLWSMAGNLAMVYRVLMGMSFETVGLHFQPAIPEVYGGQRSLTNFKYRDAILDIRIHGHGKTIAKFAVDGIEQKEAFVPATLSGNHTIEIEMANEAFPQQGMNMVDNAFSLATPRAQGQGDTLRWEALKGAASYNIYRNGVLRETTSSTMIAVPKETFAEYKVSALDERGFESFTSEPVLFADDPLIFEMETFAKPSEKSYSDFTGKGFVEVSVEKNRSITCSISVKEEGDYILDLRYSNGSGHWNTDNMCAIRSLFVNEAYQGALIFPQRGKDEWSDWGFSNSYLVRLNKGQNSIRIAFEEWNHNMNVEVNTAMVDYVRLYRI
jgi:hypothetical protein